MKKTLYILALITILSLTACSGKDEPDNKFNDITLDYNKTYTIPNGTGTTWKTSNNLIASVSGNVVKAEHVGIAIISSEKGSFKVTVKPTMNTYPEPCLDWGTSMDLVKSFMNSYTGNVFLSEQDYTSLLYQSSSINQKVLITLYLFENSKLYNSVVLLNLNYIPFNNLVEFLSERYIPVSVDDSNYRIYFINPEMDMGVVLQLATMNTNTSTIDVVELIYAPAYLSTKADVNIKELINVENTNDINLNSKFEELKSLLL